MYIPVKPFISSGKLCHTLLWTYVWGNFRVRVTHVGTLSGRLAWPRVALVDFSWELRMQTLSVRIKNLAGCLCDWTANWNERIFFFFSGKWHACLCRDMNLLSQCSRIVPQQTSNIHQVWNMKSFHLSNSVSEMLPVGSRFHSDCKIHETALGHTSDRGPFNTVGLGWYSFLLDTHVWVLVTPRNFELLY